MSMVSTIMPSSANFCFPAQNSPGRSTSRVYSPPSALKIEAGPLSNYLTVPGKVGTPPSDSSDPPASPSETIVEQSKSPSKRHSHRRSAAVSHDFGTSPIIFSSPKNSPPTSTPSSFPYNNRSPTLTFASSSCSLQQSSTFSASASSLPLEDNNDSPKKKNLPKVTFNEPVKVENDKEPETEIETDTSSSSTTYHSLTKTISNPPLMKVSSSSSISPNKGVSKSKSRRLRHKKVKSWAGNLIRFGSKKDHKRQSSQDIVSDMKMDIDNDNDDNDNFNSPSYNTLFSDSPSFSPEPKIDLDAALGPFRNSTDSEFNSFQYFHRRSESAPEMTLGPAFRGLKRKMGPVVEEESEDDDTTTAAMSNVTIDNNSKFLTPKYYTGKGYQTSAGTSPILSVFSDSTTNVSEDEEQVLEPKQETPPSAVIRVVSHLSEIDNVPTVKSLNISNRLDLGEPGPEIRCSIDSISLRNQSHKLSSSPHPSNASFTSRNRLSLLSRRRPSQESSLGSVTSKRNVGSRVWGWIKGEKTKKNGREK